MSRKRRCYNGDYVVGQEIASGGFATVHVGRQISTGRKVAIKVLQDGRFEEDHLRFRKEAEYLSQLKSPNISGFGWPRGGRRSMDATQKSIDEEIGMVSKWAKGLQLGVISAWSGLMDRLDQLYLNVDFSANNEQHQRRIANLFIQAAEALAEVHKSQLLHRDIKPSNMMVTGDDRLVLMDFGVARLDLISRTLITKGPTPWNSSLYVSRAFERRRCG
ncbi:MAG: protein kinase [Planctomycetaceae bacterium]